MPKGSGTSFTLFPQGTVPVTNLAGTVPRKKYGSRPLLPLLRTLVPCCGDSGGSTPATPYTLASNMSVRASSQNARLLVVEDDPDISMLLAHSLGRAGFAVETLSSGTEVLAEARRRTPDLILLDLMLPGLD